MKRFYALVPALILTLTAASAAGFQDVPADAWYAENVAVCSELGLVEGRGGDLFDPDAPLTYGECWAVAARLHSLQNGGDGTLPEPPADWGSVSFTFADGNRLTSLDNACTWVQSSPTTALLYVPLTTQEDVETAGRCAGQSLTYTFDGLSAPVAADTIKPKNGGESSGATLVVDPHRDTCPWPYTPEPGVWYRSLDYYLRSHGLLERLDANRVGTPATRMDFVEILTLAAGGLLEPAVNEITALPDVLGDTLNAVLPFYRAGILTGKDEYGTFAGTFGLTRAELAARVSRLVRPELRLSFTPKEPEYAPYTLTPLPLGDLGIPIAPNFYDPDFQSPAEYRAYAGYMKVNCWKDPNGWQGEGFVDRSGAWAVRFQDQAILEYEPGGLILLSAGFGDETAYAVADFTGRLVLPYNRKSLLTIDHDHIFSDLGSNGVMLYNSEGEKLALLPRSITWTVSEGLIPYYQSAGDAGSERYCVGYLDTKGNVVIPADDIYRAQGAPFSEGLAAVHSPEDPSAAFITPDGKAAGDGFLFLWDTTEPDPRFSEGYAAIQSLESGKWGAVDHAFQTAVPFVYDSLAPCSEGLFRFTRGAASGFVAPGGAEFETPYVAFPFSGGYAACYGPEGGKMGYIGKNGRLAIPALFDYAGPMVDGSAFVIQDYQLYLLSIEGETHHE